MQTRGGQVDRSTVLDGNNQFQFSVGLSVGTGETTDGKFAGESTTVVDAGLSVDVTYVASDNVEVSAVPLDSIVVVSVNSRVDIHKVVTNTTSTVDIDTTTMTKGGTTKAEHCVVVVQLVDITEVSGILRNTEEEVLSSITGTRTSNVGKDVSLNPGLGNDVTVVDLEGLGQEHSTVVRRTEDSVGGHLAGLYRVNETSGRSVGINRGSNRPVGGNVDAGLLLVVETCQSQSLSTREGVSGGQFENATNVETEVTVYTVLKFELLVRKSSFSTTLNAVVCPTN